MKATTRRIKNAGPSLGRDVETRWAVLKAKIEPHASLLATQGVLVLKRLGAKRFWFLRFLLPANTEGHRRHCSIYICREDDQDLEAHARQLLKEYRETQLWASEVSEWAAFAVAVKNLLRKQMRSQQGCH